MSDGQQLKASVSVPAAVVIALVTALASAGSVRLSLAPTEDMRQEVRDLRREVREVREGLARVEGRLAPRP